MGSTDAQPAENGRRPHVALLAFPFGTHAPPLFDLARALSAAAPDAALSFFGSAHCNARFRAGPVPPNLRFYDVPDGCPEDPDAPPLSPQEEVRRFLELTPGNFREALVAVEAEHDGAGRLTCVVSDAFLWFAGELAAEAGAPWVAFFTGGPASLSAHVYTDVLRAKIGSTDQEDEQLSFIPGLSELRAKDLPEGIISGDLSSSFACLLHRMGAELPRSAAAVILNSFEGLNSELDADFRAKFKSSLLVGPLHLLVQQPHALNLHECLSWLDRRAAASVAYVSFGSMLSPPPAELRELAEGLEASGAPFIWSLRERDWEHLPAGFMDRTLGRGRVLAWAPQIHVIRHPAVGAFLTHCGWNSTLESITGGTPMICRPVLGDQRLNARSVSHLWKIGVKLEGEVITKDSVVSALNDVLGSEEGKKMKERVEELRMKALKATSFGGSSVENLRALVKIVTSC